MNRKKRVAIPENALELARLVAEAHQDDDPVRRKVQRSCDRYRLKLTQGLTSRRSDGDLARQLDRFTRAEIEKRVRDDQVKNTLYTLGVLPCNVFNYMVFSHQIDGLKRQFSGRSLANRARQVFESWVVRGLEPKVLVTILSQVFNITLPSTVNFPDSGV